MKGKEKSDTDHDADGASAENSIDRTIDDLITSATSFAHAFIVVGATPWLAGRLVRGKKLMVTHSATFLFVGSFILSLTLSALVDLFMDRGVSFEDLATIAATQIQTALKPDILQATLSLFPAIICADLSARLLSRIVAQSEKVHSEMRRFALLAFAIHALVISLLVTALLLLGPTIADIAIGEALGHARLKWWEALLSWFADYLPIVVPVALALHFPVVMWFGSKAINTRAQTHVAAGTPRPARARWDLLLVAILYPLLFAVYAAATCLPQVIITSLEPSKPKGITAHLMRPAFSKAPPTRAQFIVLLENHTSHLIPIVKSSQVFSLRFTTGQNHRPFPSVDGTIVDWQSGSAPIMVLPVGENRWIELAGDVPAGVCGTDEGYASVGFFDAGDSAESPQNNAETQEVPFC